MAIREQLETQYETEITRAHQAELNHRKEIVRILSTHKTHVNKPNLGQGDEGGNDALLKGYKEENERLYARTKGT